MPRLPLISCAGWENGVAVLTIGGIVRTRSCISPLPCYTATMSKVLTQGVLTA